MVAYMAIATFNWYIAMNVFIHMCFLINTDTLCKVC